MVFIILWMFFSFFSLMPSSRLIASSNCGLPFAMVTFTVLSGSSGPAVIICNSISSAGVVSNLEHEVNFKPDVNTARWGRMASTYVEINRSVLVRELQNIGFHLDAVKKQWAKQGNLLKNAYGKYASRASIDGENAYYVCLKFDPVA